MAVVNVIHAPDPRSFDYLVLPPVSPVITRYIENNLSNIPATLTQAGRDFMNAGVQQYRKINDHAAIKAARTVLRHTVNFHQPNTVYELLDLTSIRTTQGVMQRYVMAEPQIRTEYIKQRIDGYSDNYIDVHDGAMRHDHYDYRRVMDGMVVETDDSWVVNTYAHDTLGNDADELTLDEKVNIISTWEFAKMCLEAGEDPTDILA